MQPIDFDTYVRGNAHRLLRFAAVLTDDNGLAEDVVQNVLIKAADRWARISTVANPHAYVSRMVVNELTSWRRKWARYVPHPDAALDRAVDDPVERVDDRLQLTAALASLPPRQRAALVLRYLEDLSDAQIAAVLGCRETTVRGYVHRGLAALRIERSTALVPDLAKEA